MRQWLADFLRPGSWPTLREAMRLLWVAGVAVVAFGSAALIYGG